MDRYPEDVEQKMKQFADWLSEKDRRRYAAIEALKLGHGGIDYIAHLLGCDPKTIRQGLQDLEQSEDPAAGRVRKKRGDAGRYPKPAPAWSRTCAGSWRSSPEATPCGSASSGPTCPCGSCRGGSWRWGRRPAGGPSAASCVNSSWGDGPPARRRQWASTPTATPSPRTSAGCARSSRPAAARISASKPIRKGCWGTSTGRGRPTRSKPLRRSITTSAAPARESSFRPVSTTWPTGTPT